jgi:hypothetical protein
MGGKAGETAPQMTLFQVFTLVDVAFHHERPPRLNWGHNDTRDANLFPNVCSSYYLCFDDSFTKSQCHCILLDVAEKHHWQTNFSSSGTPR